MKPLLLSLLLTGAGEGLSQGLAPLDLEKAVTFGSGRGDIPLLTEDDAVAAGTCETVELASPALRVARVARKAIAEGRPVDREAVSNAARSTLSVLYNRLPFRTEGQRWDPRPGGILTPPGAPAPVPCVEERRPERLLLAGASGGPLDAIRATEVHERGWTGKRGASGVTLGATAEFDLEPALALGGGKWLEVRVTYAEGPPSTFRFSSKQVKSLTPSWAR